MARKHYKWVKAGAGMYRYLYGGKIIAEVIKCPGGWQTGYRDATGGIWKFGGLSPTLERAKHYAVGFVRGW